MELGSAMSCEHRQIPLVQVSQAVQGGGLWRRRELFVSEEGGGGAGWSGT